MIDFINNKNIVKHGSDSVMSNKIFLLIFIGLIFMLPMIAAEEQSLGTFKVNSCISLKQTCSNCSFVNITSVISPAGEIVLGHVPMTKTATEYNYTFCGTSTIGNYIYNTLGNPDGINTVQPVAFEITPSGFADTLGFYFIIIAVLIAVIALGFWIKDGWFVVIGGLSLIILGVYSINNGIAGFRDSFLTWGIALFEMGVGAYLSINSAIELIGNQEVN